jgi:putative Holliday junction resolvase
MVVDSMTTSVRVLGFDFGTRKIGVAFGQSITGTAQPLTALVNNSQQPLWRQIEPLINTWKPTHLLVGLPTNMDDSPSVITELTQQFIQHLHNHCDLPIISIDERLSTRAVYWQDDAQSKPARSRKKRVARSIDAQAAAILIEDWFKSRV